MILRVPRPNANFMVITMMRRNVVRDPIPGTLVVVVVYHIYRNRQLMRISLHIGPCPAAKISGPFIAQPSLLVRFSNFLKHILIPVLLVSSSSAVYAQDHPSVPEEDHSSG